MDIVEAARRGDGRLRVRSASTEGVEPASVAAKDGCVFIDANFDAEFKRVRTARVGNVVLNLVDVSIRAIDRTVRGVEPLKEAVTISKCGIGVIDGWENGRAADVAENCG